jgi:hypothetical protein
MRLRREQRRWEAHPPGKLSGQGAHLGWRLDVEAAEERQRDGVRRWREPYGVRRRQGGVPTALGKREGREGQLHLKKHRAMAALTV